MNGTRWVGGNRLSPLLPALRKVPLRRSRPQLPRRVSAQETVLEKGRNGSTDVTGRFAIHMPFSFIIGFLSLIPEVGLTEGEGFAKFKINKKRNKKRAEFQPVWEKGREISILSICAMFRVRGS